MRVAFDAGPLLGNPTGVGRYARELAEELESAGVEVVRYAFALRGTSQPGIRRWRLPARAAQLGWRRFGWPEVERLTGDVDVIHGTNFVLPSSRAPGVVTVHDLSFLRDDVFPGGERLRELVPWSVSRAARVLVPTRAIAAEVAESYRVSPDRIVVTPEGVAPVFFGATPLSDLALAGLGIAHPYAIAVGTLEPRKNLATLMRAWEMADLEGWTLGLAGPKGWGPDLPETRGVLPIGWVGDETLPGLLAGAEVFCYPSMYEGFGLPPLEAMAAGTPALVGSYSAAHEVLGDAAVVVDPGDAEALADGLARLAGDKALRSRLRVQGRARAGGFSWAKTAELTMRGYAEAVAERGAT
jgi:glycosyltransferase involved in cell wall biosynthesis